MKHHSAMHRIALSLAFLGIANTASVGAHILDDAPEAICAEAVQELPRQFDMVLSVGETTWHLQYDNGEAAFAVHHFGHLPPDLTPEQKHRFIVSQHGKHHDVPICYSYHHSTPLSESAPNNALRTPLRSDYDRRVHIYPPRAAPGAPPKKVSPQMLAQYLAGKRVLFYTGAGTSVAAGIYTVNQLLDAMGIDTDTRTNIDRILEAPDSVLAVCKHFGDSLYRTTPTPAHRAIAALSHRLAAPVLTENFDLLHEKTGIAAFHVDRDRLLEEVAPSWLEDVDVIVCIGLSADQRGLLGWYKHHNSNGAIVAIDLATPSYLGPEDLFLQGDAQIVVPELLTFITLKNG